MVGRSQLGKGSSVIPIGPDAAGIVLYSTTKAGDLADNNNAADLVHLF